MFDVKLSRVVHHASVLGIALKLRLHAIRSYRYSCTMWHGHYPYQTLGHRVKPFQFVDTPTGRQYHPNNVLKVVRCDKRGHLYWHFHVPRW